MKNDDVQLIQRVLDGDDTAFSTLVGKYQKQVHALAWRKLGDFHIAEDITQETFLKAYQRLSTLKEPQSFASWLYVITANHCNTWLRKRRLRTQSLETASGAELEKATYSGYVSAENERTTAEAQREIVKKLLAKLKESDRTVITLYYFGGMTYEEISKFLGVSVGAIKNRVYRAQERLKKEEPMIREALENFQIAPNLTENIMREIARLKPVAPSSSKPFAPWAIGVSTLAVMFLILGIANHQSLSRFQKPYSFNAASEMKVELIDAPVVLNLESEPDDRVQLGNASAKNKNNGIGNQVNDAASLDLETIITKMKHYDNAVTSVTGDFVIERHQDHGIEKIEYRLMFEGEKIQLEGGAIIEYWDGERSWKAEKKRRMIFKFEIPPGKRKTDLEMIRQAFKHNGVDLANDVRIVDGDEPESFTLVENETGTTYSFWLDGETTLLVYDYHLEYSVHAEWLFSAEADPRFWLTFSLLDNKFYLSEPLWHLLEKHESEIIGSEVLNGEKTSVINLNIPAHSKGDFKRHPLSVKLWISHDKGFRLVKSERTFAFADKNPGVPYIATRKIVYHEYLPDVWFPKRIEAIAVPKASSEQQDDADFLYKNILITKQCRINTDITEFLSLPLPPETKQP